MTAIILSGGDSFRMKYPKAFLELPSNKTLINHIVNVYQKAGINEIIIIINHSLFDNRWHLLSKEIPSNTIIIKNNFPERGRSYSINLGLSAINNTSGCFIQNIDNPEINPELIVNMMKLSEENSFIVPEKEGKGGHPILIGKKIIKDLKEKKESDWILRDELKKYNKKTIDSGSLNVLLNLNHPNEWETYIKSKNIAK